MVSTIEKCYIPLSLHSVNKTAIKADVFVLAQTPPYFCFLEWGIYFVLSLSDFSFITMNNSENINMTGAIEPMVLEVVQKLAVENKSVWKTPSRNRLTAPLKEGSKELGNILFQFGANNWSEKQVQKSLQHSSDQTVRQKAVKKESQWYSL